MTKIYLIIYAVICIILFVIWYKNSHTVITNNINESCRTKENVTNSLLTSIVIRFIIFLCAGYAILYIFADK